MDFDLSKILVALFGVVGTAIGGAWLAASRATAALHERAAGDPDGLLTAAQSGFQVGWQAGVRGFFLGALVGVVLVGIYFWYTNPDRPRRERASTDEDHQHWA